MTNKMICANRRINEGEQIIQKHHPQQQQQLQNYEKKETIMKTKSKQQSEPKVFVFILFKIHYIFLQKVMNKRQKKSYEQEAT